MGYRKASDFRKENLGNLKNLIPNENLRSADNSEQDFRLTSCDIAGKRLTRMEM
jgi:hypothetical protein